MIKKLLTIDNSLFPKSNQNTARMLKTKSFGATAKWLCFVLLLMVSFVNAATRTASVTGDWNSTTTWGGAAIPTAADDVIVNSGVTVTVGTSAATCLNLNVLSGGFLTIGGFNLTVTGETNISGTLTHNNISGSKTFTGNVTINTGGVWNETVAAIINFGGNLTNNNNFTGSTGIHTFTGTGKTINGSNPVVISNVTITGTTTNNSILTVSNSLAGTGTLTNADTSTLNLGGTVTITNLIANANGNTVNYNGSAQTVKAITYNDLILSGSGIKTFPASTLIINNLLAISSGVIANLNGNTSHIAGILRFVSVNQLIGNYGGTGSGAGTINSTFFTSNSGQITVSGSPIDNDYASYGTTGDVGGTIPETGGGFTLTAPTGSVLINVKFASYGLPTGTYPSYGLGSCHATTSKDNTIALLGNTSWSFNATGGVLNAMYGDPCVGTVKRYNVVATYGQPICTTSTPGTILINGSTPTRGTGAYTYTWEKSTTSATTGYSIISGANSKDYTVPAGISQTTWYRRNVTSGSYTSNTIVIVQVNKAPSLTLPTAAAISGTTAICAGNSTTLTVSGGSLSGETVASGDKGGYIQWYSGACAGSGVYIGEGNSITVSPTATTTYYVRYKNSCGESSCISTTVTTSVSITAASIAAPVCRSTTSQVTNLAYTATTGTPNNYGIVWSNTPTNSFANIPVTTTLPSGSIPITVPANTAPGTYTGKLTVRNSTTGCVSFENTFTVTVNALPIVSLTSSDADNIFCSGTSVTFTATGGTTYNFRVGGVSVQNSTSATYTTTTLTNGQAIDVIVTNAANCSVTSASITNIVNSVVGINLTKADETCSSSNNGTITTSLTGGLSNIRYIRLTQKYVNGDAYQQIGEIEAFEIFTGTNVARSSNGATATSTSNYSGSYMPASAIDGNNTGNNNFWHSASTNINEYIEVDLQSGKNLDNIKLYNRTDCCSERGQNMLLELFDTSNNLVFSKTVDLRGGTTNVVDVNLLDVSWSDAATTLNRINLDSGTYTFNYNDVLGCNNTSKPATIGITNSNPLITVQPATPTATCTGNGIQTISVTATGTALTYTWKRAGVALVNGGVISGQGSSTLTLTNPIAANAGTYTVEVSGTCSPLVISNSVIVTINSLPAAPTASVTTQPNCTVSTGTITVSSPVAGTTYSIDGSVYTNTTGIFSGVAPGPYNVTAKNAAGCFSAATAVTVNAPALKTWTGASGTNWNTVGNWNPTGVPTSADCVVIPNVTNKPVISGTNGNFFANIITINSGGTLTIDPTNTLTVTGAVTVNTGGTLTFENNSSLVQDPATTININSGDITYKRASAAMKNFDYSYWSSPVEAQTLFNLSPNTLSDKYFSYTGTGWQQEVASTTTMTPGIGYIIRTPKAGLWLNGENVIFPYSQTVQFIGKPNNGTISGQAVTSGNFYLIGNPYPSALDADEFLFKTTLNGNVNSNNDILNGTIYFWTHNTAIQQSGSKYIYKSDDYASYNGTGGAATSPGNNTPPSGNIAAGQSFFASAKGSGTIQFKNNMRVVGDNGQFFKPGKTSKTTKTEKSRLWLNMTNEGGAFKQTLIGYVTGATNDYEGDFDGVSFDGNSFIDFYSINNTNKLVIQGRALPFEENDNVPLGFRSVIAGDFTIAIDKADGLLANQKVYLEDKQTNTVHDLTEKEYTFTTANGTFNDRFVVKYTNKTLGTGDFESVNYGIEVIIKNKAITITSEKENINKVFIYDISGKQLYQKGNVSNVILGIENLKSAEQVLLIKVVLENGFQTTKKVIFK